jgi:hypothetical protein
MIEDGDIGYAGEYHASFVRACLPKIGGRATAAGDAALSSIKRILRERKTPAAEHSMTPRRLCVTPDAYWSAISRVVRGFA